MCAVSENLPVIHRLHCSMFLYSSSVCRATIRPLISPIPCTKRRIHHPWHQLVQFCQSLEPQGLFRYRETQSAHVSFTVLWYVRCRSSLSPGSFLRVDELTKHSWGGSWAAGLLLIRAPVNEDVFVAPPSNVAEMKTMDSDIQELTEQIHRLLLQVREWIQIWINNKAKGTTREEN